MAWIRKKKVISPLQRLEMCFHPSLIGRFSSLCSAAAVYLAQTERISSLLYFLLFQRHKHALNQIEWMGVECLPLTTGREKVHQTRWQPFTSTLRHSSLINGRSIFRLPLMVRGRGLLCSDLSEGTDLKLVQRVLENELRCFSSLLHMVAVLPNKLRLNTELTTKGFKDIWQLGKLQF